MDRPPNSIPLGNEEIEVVCDLLWFAKREADLPVVAEELWQRLQVIRHGDYGGNALTHLSPEEARAIVEVAHAPGGRVSLDEDEASLVRRLRSLPP